MAYMEAKDMAIKEWNKLRQGTLGMVYTEAKYMPKNHEIHRGKAHCVRDTLRHYWSMETGNWRVAMYNVLAETQKLSTGFTTETQTGRTVTRKDWNTKQDVLFNLLSETQQLPHA